MGISKKKLNDLSFMGSTVLKNQIKSGPKMRRIGIALNDKVIPKMDQIYLTLKIKSWFVTSGCFSPNLSRSICMGFYVVFKL